MERNNMTKIYQRSIFLVLGALLIASLAVACGAPAAEAPPAEEEEAAPPAEDMEAEGPASLDFVVWSYGIETIQDNIANFQEANPDCEINLQDYSWLDYHDTMVGRFAAGDPAPLLDGSDHWMQEWSSAGWLGSISDNFPQGLEYDDALAPYALQGMTYEDDVYGLSYYADTIDFVYNEEHLQAAGFDAPPESWQDVWDMSVALKEQDITEYPLILAFSQEEGASIEAMISMIYGRHEGSGALFDENNNPTFNSEGSAAYEAIEWLREAYEAKLFDPASLTTAELDQVASMQAGAHTFTILPQYNMAALNLPDSGDYAGSFMIGLMPGDSHATVGYVRFYAMTPEAENMGEAAMACAWKFLEYFGLSSAGQLKMGSALPSCRSLKIPKCRKLLVNGAMLMSSPPRLN
jgi:multiple sugar transport system substrate-binding protein